MIPPIVAVVAEFEPEMAANRPHEAIVARPRPPRSQLTQAWAKSARRRAIPAAAIRSPVRMNSGSDNRPKKLSPSNSVTPTLASVKSMATEAPTTQKPMTRKIGTPIRKSTTTATETAPMMSPGSMSPLQSPMVWMSTRNGCFLRQRPMSSHRFCSTRTTSSDQASGVAM